MGLGILSEIEATADTSALPRRPLGRTGQNVTILGLGMAPMGSNQTSVKDVEILVSAAYDQGIRYVDVSPDYGNAESKLKTALRPIRDRIYLVSKVNPDRPDINGVQKQIEESLARLGVDHLDAVHIHNLGDWDMGKLFAADGAIAGLKVARKRGLIRHIGTSGHSRPPRFVTAIEAGDVDLTMNQLNFTDRNSYRFDEQVLPAARKHNVGIVAMKVLGGAVSWRYDARTPGVFAQYHEQAIRYSVGIPGVACAVIGLANPSEVAAAVAVARRFKPLTSDESASLLETGKRLAANRAGYYGPVDG